MNSSFICLRNPAQHNFKSWRLKAVLCLFCNLNKTFFKRGKRQRFFSRPKQLLRIDEKSSSASVPQHHCAHRFCWKRGRTALPGSRAEDAVCSLAASNMSTQLAAHSKGFSCSTSQRYRYSPVLHYQGLSVLQEFCSLWDITVHKKKAG